jgi:hypothetical protein
MPPYHYPISALNRGSCSGVRCSPGLPCSVPALSLEVTKLWPPSNRTLLSAGVLACAR